VLAPGHGPVTTVKNEKEHNPSFLNSGSGGGGYLTPMINVLGRVGVG